LFQRATLLVALLVLLSPSAALAESAAVVGRGRSPWLGFGLGAGGFSGVTGLAGHVDLGMGFGKVYVAGRLAGVTDTIACCESNGGDLTDAGLIFGLQRVTATRVLAIGAGPASAKGRDIHGHEWGLGLEARFVGSFSRRVGLGVYAFANLNSTNSMYGVTIGLRIGGH